ncbi:FAD-dependent monooxygenase [Mycolicibacterium elephantis]|uniref:NAD(P)/FAD-dependent oxidoreductase n=1 Tax=Mycolicibacterium elephantis TaxID=81858 RepID=UPI003A88E893
MNAKDAVRFGSFEGRHAVVIGASTTGLAASAVAARHFGRVTTIDRDRLPDAPTWRKGAPQSHHGHILLRGGQNVFNHYFPGLTTDLLDQGSVEVDMANDICWYHSGGWKKRFDSGLTMLCQTRGFLEFYLRKRLVQLPNVSLLQNTKVTGYRATGKRITGVELAGGTILDADLVIDASGRNSETPRHLSAMGFGSPEVSELKVDIGYSTTLFSPPDDLRDWKAMLIHSRPPATRTAALLPTEGGRWIVTLLGWQGDYAGGDLESFLEWAKGLPVPDLYEALREATCLEEVHRWRFPANLRRHYDKLASLPEGFVVVGDANTSLNPLYAQGMSHGAIGTTILDRCLSEQREAAAPSRIEGLSKRFHRAYSRFLDECWFTSTVEDYGAVSANGGGRLVSKAASWYLGKVTEMTWRDAGVAREFIDVMHLQRAPTSLMRPSIALKALMPSSAAAHQTRPIRA